MHGKKRFKAQARLKGAGARIGGAAGPRKACARNGKSTNSY
jgi:hypothetical protein